MPTSTQDSLAILITGGTGSFGSAFARYVLDNTPHRVRIFSRDEHKQADMAAAFPPGPRLTYVLGDVRDVERVTQAADGCACIAHAAALKLVPGGEVHTDEYVRTNIGGSQNVIQAAIRAGVGRTLLIGTDKSAAALNAYGRSKAMAESLFVHANSLGVSRGAHFAAVRGGNIWNSRGSVAQVWRAMRAAGLPLPVNGESVTRFHLEMPAWCAFCWRALTDMHGGEVFVPKARAWALGDLAEAFGSTVRISSARAGDKVSETLITADESARTVDSGWAYVLEPSRDIQQVWRYAPWPGWRPPAGGWAYSSDTADRLSVDELRALVEALFQGTKT